MDQEKFISQELSDAKCYDDILACLKWHLSKHGFSNFVYVIQVHEKYFNPPVICFTSYDSVWISQYMSNRFYDVDPIIKHSFNSLLPLYWSTEDDWVTSFGEDAADFMEEVKKFFGKISGVCLPIVSGQISTTGSLNLIFDGSLEGKEKRVAMANLFFRYAHHHVLRLWKDSSDRDPAVELTPREVETLVLACEGMTADAIGTSLYISKRTVESHLSSAIFKLNVNNRQQAISKAIALGLIVPKFANDKFSASSDMLTLVM